MDLLRKSIIERPCPIVFSSDVERLIRTAKKDVIISILSVHSDFPAWKMTELYNVGELRSILLELWKGELKK